MQTFTSGSNSELCGLGGLWPCAALLDALVLKGGGAGFAVIEAVGWGSLLQSVDLSLGEAEAKAALQVFLPSLQG